MKVQFHIVLCVVFALLGAAGSSVMFAQTGRILDPSKAITQYHLDAWTTNDGLPQNTITAITQTHDGYLWLGTQEGLVRFDGLRFYVFSKRNGALSNNSVVTLLEDRSGPCGSVPAAAVSPA